MQVDLEHRVRAASVIRHNTSLLRGALAEAVACKARALALPDWDSNGGPIVCFGRQVVRNAA